MSKKLNLKTDSTERYPTFAEILTDRICGGHNQNAIVIVDGKTGSGKSLASLRLAFDCSLLFAEKLGGHPTDYFNLDHIAILTADEAIRITENIKQFGIYILDDAGSEMFNCRNFMSDQNEMMSKLLQTFRTNNNLLIMSSPDKGFIDKVGRILMHYKISMSMAFFNKGFTLGKISTVKRISTKDYGSNLYPFLRMHGVVFNYCAFRLPPDSLRKAYEKRRKEIERQMNLAAVQDLKESIAKREEKKLKESMKCKADKEDDNKITEIITRKNNAMMYKSLVKSGMKAVDALKKCNEMTGLNLSQNTILRDYNRLCLKAEA